MCTIKLICHNPSSNIIPGTSTTKYSCYVRATDYLKYALPCYDYIDVNPRKVKRCEWDKINNRIISIAVDQTTQSIIDTIVTEPEKFSERNSGIDILADNVSFGKNQGIDFISFDLFDKTRHGVFNGNHTQVIIKWLLDSGELQKKLNGDTLPEDVIHHLGQIYIPIDVRCKNDVNDLVALVDAKNNHHPLTGFAKANLGKKFDQLKNSLLNEPYFEKIQFIDGEERAIHICRILQYLMLMDVKRYQSFTDIEGKHPTNMYNRKAAALEQYLDSLDESETNEELGILEYIDPKAILRLSDKIRKRIMSHSRYSHFGKRKGKERDNKPISLHFINETVKAVSDVHEAWVMPILASFRANIDKVSALEGKFRWHVPIDDLFENVIDTLINQSFDQKDIPNKTFNAIGRDPVFYSNLFDKVVISIQRMGK